MRMTLLTRLERACDNGMVGGVWPKIDSHCDKEEKEEDKEEKEEEKEEEGGGGREEYAFSSGSCLPKEDPLDLIQLPPSSLQLHTSIFDIEYCLAKYFLLIKQKQYIYVI